MFLVRARVGNVGAGLVQGGARVGKVVQGPALSKNFTSVPKLNLRVTFAFLWLGSLIHIPPHMFGGPGDRGSARGGR